MMFQTKTCSTTELDCVAGLEVPADQCLENCEGIIVDVGRLQSEKEDLAEMISDYEKFKYPHSANLTYPSTMKGNLNTVKLDKVALIIMRSCQGRN